MTASRPSLLVAVLWGSLENLAVSVLAPVLLASALGMSLSGQLLSELTVVLFSLTLFVTGSLFLLRECLILIPLTFFLRARFSSLTAKDLTNAYTSALLTLDVILGVVLAVFLFRPGEWGVCGSLFLLWLVGLAGALRFVRAARNWAVLAPDPEQVQLNVEQEEHRLE